jgi:predicted neuraminidase
VDERERKTAAAGSRPLRLLGALAALALVPAAAPGQSPSPIVQSEFIYERAPFAAAHASTIVETDDGLAVAWFGGTEEGNPDVGIWLSRHDGKRWSAPVEVANGAQPDGTRYPCWNPVLFLSAYGPLLLFYKVGPDPASWWGLARTSRDDGRTWSAAISLPRGILGPIRAKPVELPDGALLAGSSTERTGWMVHLEWFRGPGDSAPARADWGAALASPGAWRITGPLNDPAEFAAIQPTILVHSAAVLQILCRSRQGVITEAWSRDGGSTWSPMTATALPNPSAGIDAIRLADGRFLLAYNPTTRDRSKLAIAISSDGTAWRAAAVLVDSAGEYSYPAMIQTRDGLVHVTYTWNRQRIRHVVLDPSRIV